MTIVTIYKLITYFAHLCLGIDDGKSPHAQHVGANPKNRRAQTLERPGSDCHTKIGTYTHQDVGRRRNWPEQAKVNIIPAAECRCQLLRVASGNAMV